MKIKKDKLKQLKTYDWWKNKDRFLNEDKNINWNRLLHVAHVCIVQVSGKKEEIASFVKLKMILSDLFLSRSQVCHSWFPKEARRDSGVLYNLTSINMRFN
ncbi:hypothetical protein BpHYR1_038434 [Brachionus plicatilis]|uniref:Uncharacterized protein n=1 Tax=Brachionus plicatilis TaxID=10195 RepID=A0A3M7PZS2_BRAPC|nr:hypothetical protein BpHYR1_038434 [Brachionus plicatilis]